MLAEEPSDFHVFVYFLGRMNRGMSLRDLASCGAIVRELNADDIASMKSVIRQDLLDVLVYPEIGMAAAPYFLAMERLAPIVTAFWGHPQTSGMVGSVDYFITSENFHLRQSDDLHPRPSSFIEELWFMKGITTAFKKPLVRDSSELRTQFEELQLPGSATVYSCLQALFKLTPKFDLVIRELLRGDPSAILLLLSFPSEEHAQRTRERLSRQFVHEPP